MTYLKMADAAFAANIPPGFDIAGGYYGGPEAYHVWTPDDWGRFPGYKVPIWVGGYAGVNEGIAAVRTLGILGVPQHKGLVTALDMETRVDKTYVNHFGAVLQSHGYRVWVYGSVAMAMQDPQLNGYWLADYFEGADPERQAEVLIAQSGVRAVQYAAGALYDESIVKPWTSEVMWK